MKSKFYLALLALAAFCTTQVVAEDAKPAKAETQKAEKQSEKKEKGAKTEAPAKPATDGEALKADGEAMTKALQANDVTKVLTYFADDFKAPMISNKETLKALLEMGSNSGTFSGLTADTSKTKYEVNGDKATVGPTSFATGGDSGTATFTCVKKEGAWKITSLDITGVSF